MNRSNAIRIQQRRRIVRQGFSPRDDKPIYAFLTSPEIVTLVVVSFVGALFLAWVLGAWSLWLLIGFAGFLAPLVHFCLVSGRTLAFPLFLPAIFALQHVISTVYCYIHPMARGLPVSIDARAYFPMAVMATWLMYAGVLLPMSRVRSVAGGAKQTRPALLRGGRYHQILLLSFWCGITFTVMRGTLGQVMPSMAFVWLLLARLSYVSVVALAIVGSKRFNTFLVLLAIVEGLGALQSSIFHPILFFFLMIGCVAVFSSQRWPAAKVALALVIAAFCVYSLQCIKGPYRDRIKWREAGMTGRLNALYASIYEYFSMPQYMFSESNRHKAMDRFDQGQVVSLVMRHVPASEAYAQGETVLKALRSAVLPRVISPEKYVAGGSEFFERFTGYRTTEETSMNLGQLAEFYANFGKWGALVGCTVYALLLGWIWRFFHMRALSTPLWWAFFPYVAMGLVKTEDGLGEILNYAVKAALVSLAMIMAVPGWRQALNEPLRRFRKKPGQSAKQRFRHPASFKAKPS